jgi:hypothetical protein
MRIPTLYSMDAEGLATGCLRYRVKAVFEHPEANGAKYNLGGPDPLAQPLMKSSYVA